MNDDWLDQYDYEDIEGDFDELADLLDDGDGKALSLFDGDFLADSPHIEQTVAALWKATRTVSATVNISCRRMMIFRNR